MSDLDHAVAQAELTQPELEAAPAVESVEVKDLLRAKSGEITKYSILALEYPGAHTEIQKRRINAEMRKVIEHWADENELDWTPLVVVLDGGLKLKGLSDDALADLGLARIPRSA